MVDKRRDAWQAEVALTLGPKGMWSVPPLPIGLALPSRPPAERPHLTPSCCSCRNSVSPSSRPLGGRGAARRTVAVAGRGWRRKRRPRCNGVDTGMEHARRRKSCPLPSGRPSRERHPNLVERRNARKCTGIRCPHAPAAIIGSSWWDDVHREDTRLQRSCCRPRQRALWRLEPYAGKPARTVLRGGTVSNGRPLPGS